MRRGNLDIETRSHTRRLPRNDGGRAGSDVSPGQGMPRIAAATGSWETGSGRIVSHGLQRQSGPADTLISDFWPPD